MIRGSELCSLFLVRTVYMIDDVLHLKTCNPAARDFAYSSAGVTCDLCLVD